MRWRIVAPTKFSIYDFTQSCDANAERTEANRSHGMMRALLVLEHSSSSGLAVILFEFAAHAVLLRSKCEFRMPYWPAIHEHSTGFSFMLLYRESNERIHLIVSVPLPLRALLTRNPSNRPLRNTQYVFRHFCVWVKRCCIASEQHLINSMPQPARQTRARLVQYIKL